jgi:saccharopine dehydrogenase (NAD+, L-lysine-forming)
MDFNLQHFFKHPEEYISTFKKYTEVADIYMACHFWDPNSPVFITKEDMQKPEFNISVIADVSCDVNGPIASTLRSSTIADPFYGYNIKTKKEEPAFTSDKNITVMAVDNLPGELPRNSSADFCHKLLNDVFPFLLGNDDKKVIERGTITNNGKLTDKFNYLQDYIDGKE